MLKPQLTFLSVEELMAQPDPNWLLPELLFEQSLVVLYGNPGDGKTFLALDWALRIATGAYPNGDSTSPGQVLYVVAEGGMGFRKRVHAWQVKHPGSLANFMILKQPVGLHESVEVERLAAAIRASGLHPRLIVFDTLAQNFVGGEENSAAEMGRWLQGARSLQEEFGSTVLALHHSTKAGGGARGSGALKGAADTMMELSRSKKDGVIRLKCEKQKDAECFVGLQFELRDVPGTKSAVVVSRGEAIDVIPSAQFEMLKALASLPNGATSKDWRAATRFSERTFHRHRNALLDQGTIEQNEHGHYQVTESGTTAIAAMAVPLSNAA